MIVAIPPPTPKLVSYTFIFVCILHILGEDGSSPYLGVLSVIAEVVDICLQIGKMVQNFYIIHLDFVYIWQIFS